MSVHNTQNNTTIRVRSAQVTFDLVHRSAEDQDQSRVVCSMSGFNAAGLPVHQNPDSNIYQESRSVLSRFVCVRFLIGWSMSQLFGAWFVRCTVIWFFNFVKWLSWIKFEILMFLYKRIWIEIEKIVMYLKNIPKSCILFIEIIRIYILVDFFSI